MSVKEKFEKEFYDEDIEMLVLMKSGCNGAVVYGDMLKPSVDFLASIDLKTGVLSKTVGRIKWMIKNDKDRKGWGYDFQQFGIYHVKVKKCIPQKLKPYQMELLNNRYMLIDIVEENERNIELEKLKDYFSTPIIIENELGTFELNREFSSFEGQVKYGDIEISVLMETDEENGDTATNAMKALLHFSNHFKDLDQQYRMFAAKELTDSANEWLEDDDNEEKVDVISEEMFMNRIQISEVVATLNGELILYYNDDIFWGHIIEINIDDLGHPIEACIAG